MTTPGPPVGPTAADSGSGSGSGSAGWSSQEPGLARPYAPNQAREYTPGRHVTASEELEATLPPDWRPGAHARPGAYRDWRDYYDGDYHTGEFGTGDFGTGEFSFPPSLWAEPATKTRERDTAPPAPSPSRTGPPRAGAAPAATATATAAPPAQAAQGASIVRSSSVMAIGTIASRVTGFLRSAIILYALGTHFLGDAYNLANTVPNAVYNVAIGGVLTSVVVPLLVSAAKRDSDRGEAYDQRIFTLGVLALGAITLVATVAAVPISAIYAHGIGSASAYHLTVVFAYFFLPQIFFYGVSSLAGAILNARGSFAAPMWTPVINNVVVIVVGIGFMVVAGLNRTPENITAVQVQFLGIGTTLGIILQTVALIPSLRRVGFRWRPRYDFRRSEVSEIGRMGSWMFGYVLTTQASFVVTALVANRAGAHVPQGGAGAGFAAYTNAWQLFQLPYAIVGISVITAMLPRMSAHAASRNYALVRDDFSGATRLASVIVVPAALILAVLGAPLAAALFSYGSTSVVSARYLGEIFAVFSLGLFPYMLFQLQLRVFYALHDSRTPAMIGFAAMAMNIAANLLALVVLPPKHVVAGLGAGFGLANLTGCVLAWRVLSRRLGGLDGPRTASSLIRMHAAALPPAVFAIAVSLTVGVVFAPGRLSSFVIMVVAVAGALPLYVMFARAFGVDELGDLTGTVMSRFRRLPEGPRP